MRQNSQGAKGQRDKWTKVILLGMVILVAWEYARLSYVSLLDAQIFVWGVGERPYVFRTLIPWLARILVWLGFREDAALSTVMVFSAIGLVYGIKYFISGFRRS